MVKNQIFFFSFIISKIKQKSVGIKVTYGIHSRYLIQSNFIQIILKFRISINYIFGKFFYSRKAKCVLDENIISEINN